ncbi:glycogen/starch/alpha-glucan phosphorylase [Paucibacter sp. O1-1]|nr:glycogen/starch/alpha-glucan phosphorylase [Paucibacter sp. O1-1]MDA3831388.1 glycogen/starch/alpha-glucan phosphorylase [Paucibacter sp. O1-1]
MARAGSRALVIFAGKAASAYVAAKQIIQLIHDVARVVNSDPRVGDRRSSCSCPTTASAWPRSSSRRPT